MSSRGCLFAREVRYEKYCVEGEGNLVAEVLLGAGLAGETELLVDVKLAAEGVSSHDESGAV